MLTLKNCHIEVDSNVLLEDFSCQVNNGEVLSIMGPSGCGKSSLLNYLSGTLSENFTTKGALELDDQQIGNLSTIMRKVGILYQSPLLFPHMTNLENLLFALPADKERPHSMRVEIAMNKLVELGLGEKANLLPDSLSGGQPSKSSTIKSTTRRTFISIAR